MKNDYVYFKYNYKYSHQTDSAASRFMKEPEDFCDLQFQ